MTIDKQALREAAERAMHDDWEYDTDIFHEQVTPSVVLALLDECAALAAENEGLKGGIKQAFEDMEAHHDDDGLFSYDADGEPMDALLRLCDAQGSITSLMNYETPATDDFLAEVRAQGADELAELYFTLAAHEANRYIADSWRESARFAKDYAVQIRKGAAQ